MLLRGAMDPAARFANRIDVEHFHPPARIELLQQLLGAAIGGLIAKLRRNHRAVADVVVDVARDEIG